MQSQLHGTSDSAVQMPVEIVGNAPIPVAATPKVSDLVGFGMKRKMFTSLLVY